MMTFRTLLIVKAVVCLAFGVLLLTVPSALFGILGTDLAARGAILLSLLVYDAIALVVTLQAVLSGVLNVLGWGIVAVYGFFTIASGYLLFREKPFRRANAKDGT